MIQSLYVYNNPINNTVQDRNRGVISKSYGSMVRESYDKDIKNTALCFEARELLKEFKSPFAFV